MRGVKGTKARAKIRGNMMEKLQDVQHHVSTYRHGRLALLRMGCGGKWKPITPEDLHLSADISEANRTGQNRHKLPWFWQIEGDGAGIEGAKMKECKSMCLFRFS